MTVSVEHVHVRVNVHVNLLAASLLPLAEDENGGEQGAKGEARRAEGRKRKLLWLKRTIIY